MSFGNRGCLSEIRPLFARVSCQSLNATSHSKFKDKHKSISNTAQIFTWMCFFRSLECPAAFSVYLLLHFFQIGTKIMVSSEIVLIFLGKSSKIVDRKQITTITIIMWGHELQHKPKLSLHNNQRKKNTRIQNHLSIILFLNDNDELIYFSFIK